jgi:transposase
MRIPPVRRTIKCIGGHPMKKRAYRAVSLKKLNREKLRQAVEGKRLVFSVDVGKEDCFGRFETAMEVGISTIKWKNPFETKQVVDLVSSLPASSVEVAMEPSGTYGDPVREMFIRAGIPVFRVSPKRTHDAAEVYDGVPSHHDAKAAAIVAKLHWEGRSELWLMGTAEDRQISAAVDVMYMYERQMKTNLGRLEAKLARHWPEVPYLLELDSATLLELLRHYGGPEGVREHPKEAERLMRKVGKRFLREEKIEAVAKSARESIGCGMIDEECRSVKELAEEIRRNQKAQRKAEARVKQVSRDHKVVQAIAPVVGQTTAAVLQSEVGDPGGYESTSSYVKGLGLNLKVHSSGKKIGQLRITKRGSGMARMYLFMASMRLIQTDEVVKAWYLRKVARDGGRRIKAIVAVMRKLARALWHVSSGNPFDSRLLFNARRLGL